MRNENTAYCGHTDLLGALTRTPCRRCVDRAYRDAINGTRYRKGGRK